MNNTEKLSIKEAGRYSNFLGTIIDDLLRLSWGGMDSKLTKRTVLHKKNDAKKDLENEEIVEKEDTEVINDNVTLEDVDLLIDELMLEKALLSKAINLAKTNLSIELKGTTLGLDSAIEYAKLLRNKSETFYRYLLSKENKTAKGTELGYTFNIEGNQVSFQYETEIKTEILFDKNLYKGKDKEMLLMADSLSEQIDECHTRKIVEFTPKHSYLDSMEDILEKE